jgi:hypothetical protein
MVSARRPRPDWGAVRDALEAERLLIQEEIRAYPPPIPACDAAFNHLLERRAGIGEALLALEDVAALAAASGDPAAALASYIASSPFAAVRRLADPPGTTRMP